MLKFENKYSVLEYFIPFRIFLPRKVSFFSSSSFSTLYFVYFKGLTFLGKNISFLLQGSVYSGRNNSFYISGWPQRIFKSFVIWGISLKEHFVFKELGSKNISFFQGLVFLGKSVSVLSHGLPYLEEMIRFYFRCWPQRSLNHPKRVITLREEYFVFIAGVVLLMKNRSF